MLLELFVMWVIVRLLAGWPTGSVVKGGGYGLMGDMALGVSVGAGLIAAIVVASIGAVVLLGAQRMLRHVHA